MHVPKELYVYFRGVAKMVLSFSTATMIQVPTHLDQQPSVQIHSKIIITQ